MKSLVILQARMSSSRLPGKVMAQINGKPMIYWQILRIQAAKTVDKIIVATSTDRTDDDLSNFLSSIDVEVYRGSLQNVHSRFHEIILDNPSYQKVMRLTGDCPFVMAEIIESTLLLLEVKGFDYVSNTNPSTYPDGLDVEAFTRSAFLRMSQLEMSLEDLEHVTTKFRDKSDLFKIANIEHNIDLSDQRWTVDYSQDLEFVIGIFKFFKGKEVEFNVKEVLDLLETNPELNQQLPATLRNVSLRETKDVAK